MGLSCVEGVEPKMALEWWMPLLRSGCVGVGPDGNSITNVSA